MITRKHYILISGVILQSVRQAMIEYDGSNIGAVLLKDRLDTLRMTVSNLCDQLQLDNSSFSPTRFIEACGLKEVKLDAGTFEWKW